MSDQRIGVSNDFEQAVFTRSKLVKQLNYLPEKPEPEPTPEEKAKLLAEKQAKIEAAKAAAAAKKAAGAAAPASLIDENDPKVKAALAKCAGDPEKEAKVREALEKAARLKAEKAAAQSAQSTPKAAEAPKANNENKNKTKYGISRKYHCIYRNRAVDYGILGTGCDDTQDLRSATFLLFALFATAAVYFMLGYQFLGGVQIAVYAGGIVVLFVFSILLTSHPGDNSSRLESKKRRWGLSEPSRCLWCAHGRSSAVARSSRTSPISVRPSCQR